MPLPWDFIRNTLVPVPLDDHPDAPRAIFHVRIFSHSWAGQVVIVGKLTGQPLDLRQALAVAWDRFRNANGTAPFRCISYQPETDTPFREHRSPFDAAGELVRTWPHQRGPRDASATAAEVVQFGPVVDIWEPHRYTLSTFQMTRVRQRATHQR